MHRHDTVNIMTEVESHLDDIRGQILSELNKAKFSIFVASAYFTDYELANKLADKAERGLSVDLIISNSDINDSSEAIFQ
ncbi:MAG TPA: phospholipase D-like domain-containing protein, partial [Chitinophagaceae bacterium]|nr:phospholipase D-like domain-containing protein [Chitinophagaceae bacterium]